ncbi:Uncharacterised protein [Clostridium sporogenes]|nr:Uncharacterised protein [Clostridium sporogenes]
MGDGRDGSRDAVHRGGDGGVRFRTARNPGGDSQAAGRGRTGAGVCADRGADAVEAAGVARRSAVVAEGGRARVASRAVCADGGDAADRLGDAVGGRVSGDAGRWRATAGAGVGRSGDVRVAPGRASRAGLSVLPDVPRALCRGAVSRADSAGRRGEGDGGAVIDGRLGAIRRGCSRATEAAPAVPPI